MFFVFFSLSIALFNFFKIETILIHIFCANELSNCRINFFVKKSYFVSTSIETILDVFLFLNL